jgi:hypothetical protein
MTWWTIWWSIESDHSAVKIMFDCGIAGKGVENDPHGIAVNMDNPELNGPFDIEHVLQIQNDDYYVSGFHIQCMSNEVDHGWYNAIICTKYPAYNM